MIVLAHVYVCRERYPEALMYVPVGWWVAYSGAENFDYGPKQPSAIFSRKQHAEDYVYKMWPGGGYVEEVK